MTEVSCYCMDLYCDNAGEYGDDWRTDKVHEFLEFLAQYTGMNRTRCKRQAQQNGWKFCTDGRVLCPKCSGKPTN